MMSAIPPITDIDPSHRDVRFVPIADISPYSINSSVRESKLGGTVKPIALADFKLMTSSYLFGLAPAVRQASHL